MGRKIPTPAIDKLLKIVRERLPELVPREADLVLQLSYDEEDEGGWSLAGKADSSVASIAAGPLHLGAGIASIGALERDGDVLLIVRFR